MVAVKYEYNKSAFNQSDINKINEMITFKPSEKVFNLITALNDDKKPVFSDPHLLYILNAFENGLSSDQIEPYLMLNAENKPFFSSNAMSCIFFGMAKGFSREDIDIYINFESGTPKFSFLESHDIVHFIGEANDKQKQQIKECISNNLPFEYFTEFMDAAIPAENMRIYRSLYSLDCRPSDISHLVYLETKYEDLKEIKYLMQCAHDLNYENHMTYGLKSVKELRELLSNEIYLNRSFDRDAQKISIIDKCLSYNMASECIDFLTDSIRNFSANDMKTVAIGFINGLTVEEMKTVVDPIVNFDSNTTPLSNAIEEAVRRKFFDISDVEKEIEIRTNWLDEELEI